ncbi:MAG TPA: Dyp-type peroxidase [Verrucomicrobiae bacterium]|nr:Dyp-type peroxidase [Verrucomicrobiae bacterium]
MPTPQPGLIPGGNAHACFVVLKIAPTATRNAVRALARSQAEGVEIAALDARARLVMNVGVGTEMWDRVSPAARPKGLHPFKALGAEGRGAPSTGGDVLLHIASSRHDLNFELASRLVRSFEGAEIAEEAHGFRYLDSRDLTGFIDGTENPIGEARAAVALVGSEDARFAGGSYAATQRYIHDLAAWRKVPPAEQEGIVGRTKPDSVELDERRMPATSHVRRTVITADGEELKILRHSYPYGTLRESGLFFIAYGKTLDNFEAMLARMMGTSGDGGRDRLMEFSRAVTGATFFVPSMEVLASLAK